MNEELVKAAINEGGCAIVNAFREFHMSGEEEISNNAEQLLNAADFFQKLSREQSLELEQLRKERDMCISVVKRAAAMADSDAQKVLSKLNQQ